jgi:hypothetical protein
MCSPEVMANVHEAVTRRRFLGRLGAAGAASALGLAALATVPPSGATIIVGGPKHINASGDPTRPFAVF